MEEILTYKDKQYRVLSTAPISHQIYNLIYNELDKTPGSAIKVSPASCINIAQIDTELVLKTDISGGTCSSNNCSYNFEKSVNDGAYSVITGTVCTGSLCDTGCTSSTTCGTGTSKNKGEGTYCCKYIVTKNDVPKLSLRVTVKDSCSAGEQTCTDNCTIYVIDAKDGHIMASNTTTQLAACVLYKKYTSRMVSCYLNDSSSTSGRSYKCTPDVFLATGITLSTTGTSTIHVYSYEFLYDTYGVIPSATGIYAHACMSGESCSGKSCTALSNGILLAATTEIIPFSSDTPDAPTIHGSAGNAYIQFYYDEPSSNYFAFFVSLIKSSDSSIMFETYIKGMNNPTSTNQIKVSGLDNGTAYTLRIKTISNSGVPSTYATQELTPSSCGTLNCAFTVT